MWGFILLVMGIAFLAFGFSMMWHAEGDDFSGFAVGLVKALIGFGLVVISVSIS